MTRSAGPSANRMFSPIPRANSAASDLDMGTKRFFSPLRVPNRKDVITHIDVAGSEVEGFAQPQAASVKGSEQHGDDEMADRDSACHRGMASNMRANS